MVDNRPHASRTVMDCQCKRQSTSKDMLLAYISQMMKGVRLLNCQSRHMCVFHFIVRRRQEWQQPALNTDQTAQRRYFASVMLSN